MIGYEKIRVLLFVIKKYLETHMLPIFDANASKRNFLGKGEYSSDIKQTIAWRCLV